MASFTANTARILSEAGEEAAPFLDETEQPQSTRPQRRRSVLKVAGVAAVFALAGTAMWQRGGAHSAALDSGSHAFLGRAEVAEAAQTKGIKAIGEEAKALGENYERDVADEKAAAAAAAIVKKSADQVESMEEQEIEEAKKLASEAEGMVAEAQTEQKSSDTISAMAAQDAKAADSLTAQAEEDLVGAQKIEDEATGSGAKAIKDMANDQEKAAKTAKERAEAEIANANKMQDQSEALKDKAKETLAAAAKLNETTAAKTAKAEELLAAVKKLKGQADILANTSKDISGTVDSTKDAEAVIEGKAQEWQSDAKDALKAMDAAEKAAAQVEKVEAKAEAGVEAGNNMTDMATKEATAASKVEKELKEELTKLKNLTAKAEGTKDEKNLTSIIGKQTANVMKALKEAEGEEGRAADLMKKANDTLKEQKEVIAGAESDLNATAITIAKDGKLINSTKTEQFWLKYANATANVFHTMIDQDNAIAKAVGDADEGVKGLLSGLEAQSGLEQTSSEDLAKAAMDIKKIANGSSGSVKTLQQLSAAEAKGAKDKAAYVKGAENKTEALGDLVDKLTGAAKDEKADVADLQKVLDAKAAALQAARDAYWKAHQAAIDNQVQQILAKGQGCCAYPDKPDACGPKDAAGYCDAAADHCTGACKGAKYILQPGYQLAPVEVDVPNPDA